MMTRTIAGDHINFYPMYSKKKPSSSADGRKKKDGNNNESEETNPFSLHPPRPLRVPLIPLQHKNIPIMRPRHPQLFIQKSLILPPNNRPRKRHSKKLPQRELLKL